MRIRELFQLLGAAVLLLLGAKVEDPYMRKED